MNTAPKLLALALLVSACGPDRLYLGSSGETNEDATTSASSSSESNSPETSTSETTDPGETSTSETTDSGETMPFVPMHDIEMTIECDPFMQDCPDGEKCVPYASSGNFWNALKCVPVLGDQAPGEPCTYAGVAESTDDCDATSFCWNVMDGIGVCQLFCTGTADTPECPESSSCSLSSDGVVYLCITSCDPILQDCNDGSACFWANNGFNCIFTTQNIPLGEPCEFINDCAEGSGCVSIDFLPSCAGPACCSPFCSLILGDQPCDVLPGTACVPFFEQDMAPPGYEDVGVCIVPP